MVDVAEEERERAATEASRTALCGRRGVVVNAVTDPAARARAEAANRMVTRRLICEISRGNSLKELWSIRSLFDTCEAVSVRGVL